MKRMFLILLIAASLAACAYDGKPRKKVFNSPMCGAVKGYTVGYIAYGDAKLVMIPLSKVRTETVFVVGLKSFDGYDNADVTVKGTAAPWMPGKTGRYSDPRVLPYPRHAFEVGCVPAAAAVGTVYKFKVEVVNGPVTNTLDPRAEVVTW